MKSDRRMQLLSLLWVAMGGWMAFQMASGFITNPSDIPIAAYAIVNGPLFILFVGFASSGMALLRRTKRARWAIRLFSPFLFLWGVVGLAEVAYFFTQLDRYEARGLEVSWFSRLDTLTISALMILVASYSLWMVWSGQGKRQIEAYVSSQD
jgi:uncharacterized membrane protein YidH (DUF202 family)